MKGAQGVRPTDVPVLDVRATATTTVVQEISIADLPEIYTSSTEEAHLQSLVESNNRPFAQQYPRGGRSRQDLSSSGVSTPPMSAGSSAVGDSPISLPAVSPSSIEVVPSSSENRMRLAGRSQDIVGSAPGASGGSSPPTLISGEATATATGTAIARRKPVPSLVPPPVLVTAVGSEMEKDWGANGNQDVSSSALPPPLPSAPLPSPNRAYLSPSDAEGGKRWSGSYSDDTLAVMEEQRRKRAVLHRRHQHDDVEDPVEDDGTPELDLDPDSEEKGGVEVEGGLKGADDIIPFPAKPDSLGYPPSTTQRQLLQATGASAKRRREQVRDSTYTNGTKNTKGNAFKGWMGKFRRVKFFGVKIWWIVRP